MYIRPFNKTSWLYFQNVPLNYSVPSYLFHFFCICFFWWWENQLNLEEAKWTRLRQSPFYLYPEHRMHHLLSARSAHMTSAVSQDFTPAWSWGGGASWRTGQRQWFSLLPLEGLFQAISRVTVNWLIGGWHSGTFVPFNTAFLAFQVFCSDLGLGRGRGPSLPSL